jgi:hypothetical protein
LDTPNSGNMSSPEPFHLADLTRPAGAPKRRRTGLLVGIAVAVVVLLATGAGVGYALSRSGSATETPPTAGCTLGSTEELFVQEVYDCPDGTRVVTFASSKARDDYLEIATHFGAVVVEQGQGWARVRI